MLNLENKFIKILLILVIIRIAMAIALLYGFPQKGNYQGGYFYLGDEDEYFRLAFSLSRFNPVDSYRTLGFPILLLPFIWLSQAKSHSQLFLPVAIFHACILAPISIVLIALIAKKLTQDIKAALISSALWTFFPYLVYLFVHTSTSFCKDVPAQRMTCQMWLQALSDPPSTFLVLMAIYAFIISLGRKNIIYPFFTGLSFALAILVRPGNIGLATLFLSFYLFKRRLKHLILFISSSIFVATPQLIYNWHFYGSPLKLTTLFVTEQSYANERSYLIGHPLEAFSPMNFPFLMQQIILKFPPVLLFSIFVILLVIIYTLFRLYRESRKDAIILILWILPYVLIYGNNWDFYNSILRFSMPIIPALIIIISIALRRYLWFPWYYLHTMKKRILEN